MEVLRYGRRPAQVVELVRPPGDAVVPTVVLLHGGFWRARYGRELMRPLATDVVRRGWAAANVEYRRLGRLTRGGTPHVTLEDVAAALALLAEQAERVRLDARRVAAVGPSAGGQLALWAAGGDHGLAAAVSQGGVADLREGRRLGLGGGVVARFTGDDAGLARADPVRHLPTGVPVLLVHGADDVTVPSVLAERYAEAARAAGDRVELDVRPGEGHFEHLDPTSAAWRRTVAWLGRELAVP